MQIPIDELSVAEQSLLAEVDEQGAVFVNSRKSGLRTEGDRERLRVLKQLVYKNLIAFDAHFEHKQFVFVSRQKFPNYP